MKLAYRLNKDKVQTFQFNIQGLTRASDDALLFNPATSGFSLFLNHLGIFQAALSLQILASGRDILSPLLCLVEFSAVNIGGLGDRHMPGNVPGAGDRYIVQERDRHCPGPVLVPTQDEGDRSISGNSQAGSGGTWDAGSCSGRNGTWPEGPRGDREGHFSQGVNRQTIRGRVWLAEGTVSEQV